MSIPVPHAGGNLEDRTVREECGHFRRHAPRDRIGVVDRYPKQRARDIELGGPYAGHDVPYRQVHGRQRQLRGAILRHQGSAFGHELHQLRDADRTDSADVVRRHRAGCETIHDLSVAGIGEQNNVEPPA